jgi:RNA polymerase sigma-70 factor (ECF subfamily)
MPSPISTDGTNRLSDYFRSEYRRLVQYANTRLCEGAKRDAEDIVQEVMSRIFERADISGPIENLGAYVYRSLKNRIIDLLRQRDGTPVSLDDESVFPGVRKLEDRQGGPHDRVEREEIKAALCEAVMNLPEKLRFVFIQCEVEGKTFRELSKSTGLPAGTLMARKARAVALLSRQLSHLRIYLED